MVRGGAGGKVSTQLSLLGEGEKKAATQNRIVSLERNRLISGIKKFFQELEVKRGGLLP